MARLGSTAPPHPPGSSRACRPPQPGQSQRELGGWADAGCSFPRRARFSGDPKGEGGPRLWLAPTRSGGKRAEWRHHCLPLGKPRGQRRGERPRGGAWALGQLPPAGPACRADLATSAAPDTDGCRLHVQTPGPAVLPRDPVPRSPGLGCPSLLSMPCRRCPVSGGAQPLSCVARCREVKTRRGTGRQIWGRGDLWWRWGPASPRLRPRATPGPAAQDLGSVAEAATEGAARCSPVFPEGTAITGHPTGHSLSAPRPPLHPPDSRPGPPPPQTSLDPGRPILSAQQPGDLFALPRAKGARSGRSPGR